MKPEKLRKLIARPEGVFFLGIASPVDAIVCERAIEECRAAGSREIDGLYVGGYSAAGLNGWPDYGIMTGSEMIAHIERITSVTNLPVLADIDDGYGGIHNVRRAVRESFAKAKAMMVHIEDQKSPKRCGHIGGKEIIPLEEFLEKLSAAIDTKNEINGALGIIARTDAYSAAGHKETPGFDGDLEEVLRRGKEFAEAGADSIWVEFPNPSKKSIEAFARGMEGSMPPLGLAFNVSPSFKWHLAEDRVTRQELNQMGVKILFSTYPVLLEATRRTYDLAKSFCEKGINALIDLQTDLAGHPMEVFMRTIGVDIYQKIEARYSKRARVNIKTSEGFK